MPVYPELVGKFPGASIDLIAGEDEDPPSGATHLHDPAISGQHRPAFGDRLVDDQPVGQTGLDHSGVVAGDAQPSREPAQHLVAEKAVVAIVGSSIFRDARRRALAESMGWHRK
jgi:hypothetical protein